MIELLVVIAIIALLVAMLVPSLKKARDLARDMICRNNARNVAAAVHLYTSENEGYAPPGNSVQASDPGDPFAPNSWSWWERLEGNEYIDLAGFETGQGAASCPTLHIRAEPKYAPNRPERWGCHFGLNTRYSVYYAQWNASRRYWDVYSKGDDKFFKLVRISEDPAGTALLGDTSLWTRPDGSFYVKGIIESPIGTWPRQFGGALVGHTGDTFNVVTTDGAASKRTAFVKSDLVEGKR